MQKGDALAFGSNAGDLVDEAKARRAAPIEGGIEVIDREADVMNARASALDELADRRVGPLGLEKLDEGLPGLEAGDPGSVGIREVRVRQAKDVSAEGKEIADGPHRDSHVGDSRSAAVG